MNEERLNIERILPPEQIKVAEFLQREIFSQIPKNHFFLVGGTAIALKYGHRQSIDFDFFSFPAQSIQNAHIETLENLFRKHGINQRATPIYGQLTYAVDKVGITFLPFQNTLAEHERDYYKIPLFPTHETAFGFETLDIRDLAGMKAFARCQRSKMKDIVDISEILHHDLTLSEIIDIAANQFGYDISKQEILTSLIDIDDILENPMDENIQYIGSRNTEYYLDFLKKECLKFYNGSN